mgnify:CR=1 FL=1|tara:strand:- start:1896 stop:2045 length:150 start_codon:yes stop_codon:yes gene_type:complete
MVEEFKEKKKELLNECNKELGKVLEKYGADLIIDLNSPLNNPQIKLILR